MPNDFEQEFPNYFKQIAALINDGHGEMAVLKLIDANIQLLLSRLQIPHPDGNDGLVYDQFFIDLETYLQAVLADWDLQHKTSHTLQIHLGSGTVHCLLAYVYKSLHESLRNQATRPPAQTQPGSLGEFMESEIRKPEYHLRRLAMQRDENAILRHTVLGSTSDLQIYLDLYPKDSSLEELLLSKTTEFINRAGSKMQAPALESKYIALAVPEVKILQRDLKHNSTHHSLDYLTFLISASSSDIAVERLREGGFIGSIDKLVAFIQGFYEYVASESGDNETLEQIVATLNPLLQIPFLRIKDSQALRAQLMNVNFQDIPEETRVKLKKLFNDAYYSMAHNRARTEENSVLLSLAESGILPIFINRADILPNRVSDGILAADIDKLLIGYTDFTSKFCIQRGDHYELLHGTQSIQNIFSILNGGFIASTWNQGSAAYGSGLYVTDNPEYIKGCPFKIPLHLTANPNIRILDKKLLEDNHALMKQIRSEAQSKGCLDENDLLFKYYNIDVIISRQGGDEIVVQNSKIFDTPDPVEVLIFSAQDFLGYIAKWPGITDDFADEFKIQFLEGLKLVYIVDSIAEASAKLKILNIQLIADIHKFSTNLTSFIKFIIVLQTPGIESIITYPELLELLWKNADFGPTQLQYMKFNEFFDICAQLLASNKISPKLHDECVKKMQNVILDKAKSFDISSYMGVYGLITLLDNLDRHFELNKPVYLLILERLSNVTFATDLCRSEQPMRALEEKLSEVMPRLNYPADLAAKLLQNISKQKANPSTNKLR